MRKAVRAIVIKNDQFLVMHRNKFGQKYFTLIGGGVDFGETKEQSLIREITEETGIAVANPKLVFIEEAGAPYGTQYIYLCKYVAGEPKLAPNSIEAKIAESGKNLYIPMWIPISKLPEANLLSNNLKSAILDGLKDGWPNKPLTLQSKT